MIPFRERNPITIGIISMIGIAIGLAFAFYLNKIPFIARVYTIKADFRDAAGLKPENEVRVAGIKVGKVSSLELLKDRVQVELSINQGVTIPVESTAEISLKTILGTKFVAIDARKPGRSMQEGETIPVAHTKIPFEIYQAANAGVNLLHEIDAEKLNQGFQALADIGDDPNRNIAKTLEGASKVTGAIASQSEALATVLTKGDQLIASLDQSSPDLQSLLVNANKTLDVLARRRDTVKNLLENTDLLAGQFGGLISSNRSYLDRIIDDLHSTLVIVDAHLGDLEEAIRLLGPSSESLGRLLYTGPWANICIYAIEPLGTGPAPGNGPVDCAAGSQNASSLSVRSSPPMVPTPNLAAGPRLGRVG